MKEVLIIIYIISLLICLIVFIKETLELDTTVTLVEFLRIIGTLILIFIPIVNTVICFKIYKEYKKR